jgi:hypothetical protein
MLSFIFYFTNTIIVVVHYYEYQEQTKKINWIFYYFSFYNY